MITALKRTVMRALPHKVLTALVAAKYSQLFEDGLLTLHNCDFMQDSRFLQSYEKGKATGSWGDQDIHWRAYVVCWAASKARDLEGDFVECGVNKGGYSLALMHYLDFGKLPKKFYLLDTFNGLVEKYVTQEEKKLGIVDHYKDAYEECYDVVRKTFAEYKNVEIVRGMIPETLPLVKAEKVCYLSIDMNCREPEIAAAEFFWDKMVSGGGDRTGRLWLFTSLIAKTRL